MALRALLFSSDGTATSALCQVLTDLGIEAEICPEMLVAAGRIPRENYDAILVDWDQEADAIGLLKATREQKTTSQSLNLALVQNAKDVGRALQHGANSIIKKPIDPQQAQDTLSTARDLILSRHAEHKQKEARVAALKAEAAAAAAEFPDPDEAPAKKSGFLAQTAPKSAFEVEELSAKHPSDPDSAAAQESAGPPPIPADSVRDFADVGSAEKPKKRWDEKPRSYKPLAEETLFEAPRSQATCGVFSSPPAEKPEATAERRSHPQYFVFALVGCLLAAGVLWVWAPGDSYRGRMSSLWSFLSSLTKSKKTEAATVAAPPPAASQKPPAAVPSDSADETAADAALDTTEVDPSKIQIIETKTPPKPGAQQPPSTDPPTDSDQAKRSTEPEAAAAVAATPLPAQATAPASVQPVVVPVSRPHAPVSATVSPPAASDGRTAVIIPDSLKTTPSAAPASTLESSIVPEEVSRDLVASRVDPVYPAKALGQRVEGQVLLEVWVAKDGTVQDVKLVKGYFALARAAFDSVRQWRFKPYSPNGKPIDFQTYVTVTFKYPG